MGAADVVPGVSGGTIALVFGIYTELIGQVRQGARALAQLARGRVGGFVEEFKAINWGFLLPLLAGVGVAVVSLASVIDHYLETQPSRTAAVFFGLVVGSIATTLRLVRRWDAQHVGTAVAVGVVAFVVLGLRSGAVEEPTLVQAFFGGMLAICAMILPGISGSFILLMLGLYDGIIHAVDERDLALIAVFGVGAVLGLAGFSSVLTWALDRFEQLLLAGLIGLMAGSLRVLWPWPDGTETTAMEAPADDVLVPILLAVAGAALIVLVARFASVKELRSELDEVEPEADPTH